MKTSDFSYHLPEHLIARYPAATRTASRLLVVEADGGLKHQHFAELGQFLKAGDLLVMNNTKVIAARLFGRKASGGKLEILIERLQSDNTALCHVRCSRSPTAGSEIVLYQDEACDEASDFSVTMLERHDSLFLLEFSVPVLSILDIIGHIPLPPYFNRADEPEDKKRYQTVYAKHDGAVAAPTAGLHFDEALLQALKDQGIETAEITLHVGAGTFQPVKVDDVTKHHMHSEWIEVSQAVCDKVQACKARGGRVVAVGTTSVRALETASLTGEIKPFSGDTDIFIYPGIAFHCVDKLITNFHLPESTLLMLVSAFAGTQIIKNAYAEAVKQQYHFYSYGDAMLLEKAD